MITRMSGARHPIYLSYRHGRPTNGTDLDRAFDRAFDRASRPRTPTVHLDRASTAHLDRASRRRVANVARAAV
jgi:hypothetical protein